MLEGRHFVLIEDDKIMGASLLQRLTQERADVQWCQQVTRALPAIRTPRRPVDAVICDIRLPDGTGEDLFRTLLRTTSPPPFFFIAEKGDVEQAIRLIRSGAVDYITKPIEMAAFIERLALVTRFRGADALADQTGISRAARAVDRQVAQAARSDVPLMIRGMPGLGKVRLARHVHALSERRAAALVIRDALNAPLRAAELSEAAKEAGDGTLVVIGVGRLPPEAQDALFAVLRTGSPRLIATAGMGLDFRAAAGGFRADLFDLLLAHEIIVPALSERPEDAVWLARRLFALMNDGQRTALATATEDAIRAHEWPGNGRELRARMMRGIEAAEGALILPVDMFPERAGTPDIRPLAEVRDAAERAHIAAALERSGGQIAEAARALRISRTVMWEKMRKFGL